MDSTFPVARRKRLARGKVWRERGFSPMLVYRNLILVPSHISDEPLSWVNTMQDAPSEPVKFLIGAVARQSGVKPALIRMWEKRYGVVEPVRSAGGQRLYSREDAEKLKWLYLATQAGHSIGQIAHLPLADLKQLACNSGTPAAPRASSEYSRAVNYLERCHQAVRALDAVGLEQHFEHAIVELGALVFIEQLLSPLLQRIGEDWRAGELRPMHEHLATAMIRSICYILRARRVNVENTPQPRMIVTTPTGQIHELGALFAAIIAEMHGWQVIYLGASLPAEEIAAAARFTRVRAVALSLTYDGAPLTMAQELRRLRDLLEPACTLILGGAAVRMLDWREDTDDVLIATDYASFIALLDRMRRSAALAAASRGVLATS